MKWVFYQQAAIMQFEALDWTWTILVWFQVTASVLSWGPMKDHALSIWCWNFRIPVWWFLSHLKNVPDESVNLDFQLCLTNVSLILQVPPCPAPVHLQFLSWCFEPILQHQVSLLDPPCTFWNRPPALGHLSHNLPIWSALLSTPRLTLSPKNSSKWLI